MAETSLKQGQMVTASKKGGVDIRQLSIILLRRSFLILGVSCVVMSVASFLALRTKPTYQSSMQVLVISNLSERIRSNNNQNRSTDKQRTSPNLQTVDYTVQQRLMHSSKLIQKAVDLLRRDYPDITVDDIKGYQNNYKKRPLEIIPVQGQVGANKAAGQLFDVTFKNDDPVKAQKVLQALQNVYQNYNKDQQKQSQDKELAFIDQELPNVEKKVNLAEQRLQNFRKSNNMLDPEQQGKILMQALVKIQEEQRTTQAQLQDGQARYNNLQQKLAASPRNALISSRLSQSTRYQTLLDEIKKTELALAQERQRYTDKSPVVQQLLQQHQSQLALLPQELKRTLGEQGFEAAKTAVQPPLEQRQMREVDQGLTQELIQVQTTVQGLIANQQSLAESEQKLRSELNKYPNLIAEYNRLLPELENNRKTRDQLLQAQQALGLKITQAGFDWQIFEEPTPGKYLGSNRLFFLLAGGIIAPILGVLAALIAEMFNEVVYSPQDIQKLTAVRLLGTVPKLQLPPKNKRLLKLPFHVGQPQDKLWADALSWLPAHEHLDMVYQNIQILKPPLPFKSLMVTSALPGEGKSTLALGMAVSASRMHRRVLVIDANMRHPSLHEMLQLSNEWGLSLLLVDETNTPTEDYIQPVEPFIDVLTAGPTPEDTVRLLSSQRMKELVEFFEKSYDLVLIDTSAILDTVDARILADICNGIVMVERIGQVNQTELTQAIEILSDLNLVGIIANETKNSTKVYS